MMEAGRELDIEIAVKIMGWRWMRRDDYAPDRPYKLLPPLVVEGARPEFLCDNPPADERYEDKGYPSCPPPYSTDWAAMQLVVEAMRERGFRLFLMEPSCSAGWECAFHPLVGPRSATQRAATAPHAVCLAALEAVGHKVDAQ